MPRLTAATHSIHSPTDLIQVSRQLGRAWAKRERLFTTCVFLDLHEREREREKGSNFVEGIGVDDDILAGGAAAAATAPATAAVVAAAFFSAHRHEKSYEQEELFVGIQVYKL